ncbi:hypothetical protein JRO89_XS13G0251800 [Xanthoceras sorbifolium]|uniref:RING-type domain-containing protein n=1 Tax=Xanthoceras sorbifolium TaxID=99658 RepID=A0ABQ8H9W9_9ROSI|nr:hypothetical protein JRO89_XS13G0251800 [Xanthoceras sorbifolium]
MDDFDFHGPTVFHSIPKFISGAISGTLTGLFALAGAFTGAITGALAGRASDCGVLRGAGLGAIAGAVLSVEVLEASRAYWCLERSGSRGSSSMADFVEELLRGRLVDEQFTPSLLTAYHWQVTIKSCSVLGLGEGNRLGRTEQEDGRGGRLKVLLSVRRSSVVVSNMRQQCHSYLGFVIKAGLRLGIAFIDYDVSIANMSYDVNDTYGPAVSRGLSGESLKKLPCHVILDEIKATQSVCCSICLQDVEVGELARSLPRCHHTFHLACVDKWLIGHGSCPAKDVDIGDVLGCRSSRV